jgi:hypothetical protein
MVIFAKIVHVCETENHAIGTLFVFATEKYVISCQKNKKRKNDEKLQKNVKCAKKEAFTSTYSI